VIKLGQVVVKFYRVIATDWQISEIATHRPGRTRRREGQSVSIACGSGFRIAGNFQTADLGSIDGT
jgi:hypothetical protein